VNYPTVSSEASYPKNRFLFRELKYWEAAAVARTASLDTDLVDELRRYSQEQGLGPLEVD